MKITIAAVGKVKEKFFRDAVAEYSKRLGRYCTLEIVEVADEKTPDGASEALERQIVEREGARLLANIRDDDYVIALAIAGEQRSSEGLAKHLDDLMVRGRGHICFVIGGSLGLSGEVLARADEQLSFSKMTFPHQLMRVVLLEQIYRSFRIMRGEPYHK